MTREFKFRAWDGEKMHYDVVPWQWDFVIDRTSHKCVESTGTGLFGSGGKTAKMEVPAIRFKELMQFTGLKDKNGKDIYEGDKLTYTVSCGSDDGVIRVNVKGRKVFHAIVVWEDGLFVGKQIKGDGTLTVGFPLSVLKGEIIEGNIYE